MIDRTIYAKYFGPEDLASPNFNRSLYEAERAVEVMVTTLDGVNKIAADYFPTEEHDKRAVEYCICSIAHFFTQVADYEKTANTSVNGGIGGGVISSISSGSESISFSNSSKTTVARAATEAGTREKEAYNMCLNLLRGVKDKNGVNMLYAGRYPYVQRYSNCL